MEWIKCRKRLPEVVIDGEEIDEEVMCFVYSPTEGFDCVSILDYFNETNSTRNRISPIGCQLINPISNTVKLSY